MATGGLPALESVGRVFGDTSFFFASLNPMDAFHARARAISEETKLRGIEVVTTWDVVVECVALLRYRLGYLGSRTFLVDVRPNLSVVHATEIERQAAVEFFLKRAAARRLSLCDAISYVVVAGRLEWAPCLAFDEDFVAMGLTVVR